MTRRCASRRSPATCVVLARSRSRPRSSRTRGSRRPLVRVSGTQSHGAGRTMANNEMPSSAPPDQEHKWFFANGKWHGFDKETTDEQASAILRDEIYGPKPKGAG